MRTGVAAIMLISGLLTLGGCGGPQPAQRETTLQGNVFASPLAGGAPVQGARVTASLGDATGSVVTGPDGRFSLKLNPAQIVQAFTLTVEPPDGADLYASTFGGVPLEAYTSPSGAAGDMSLYLGTVNPSPALPGGVPRWGCVAGTLRDTGGQPLPSNALPVVYGAGGQLIPRPLYPNCATAPWTVPSFLTGFLGTAPQPGETGLIIAGGPLAVVRTDGQGRYLLPAVSAANLRAASGVMWAGNYDGTDTGSLETASAVFWSKFQYLPQIRVFLNGTTTTQDLQLEDFDPATNPRVTTQPIRYDGRAAETEGSASVIETRPGYAPSWLFAGSLPLGQYLRQGSSGGDDLRVLRLASDDRAQSITVESRLTRYDPDHTTSRGSSVFIGWRDGATLGQPLTATFLGIPAPQAPTPAATGTSRTPTLSWNAVPGARLYDVLLYQVLPENEVLPVWRGLTTDTSLRVPVELEAGRQYGWQVSADDSFQPIDWIASDPMRSEAARWKSAGGLPRARGRDSALNTWRGKVARATDTLPGGFAGAAAYDQHLLEKGYRFSSSQEFTFTTGN